MPNNFFIKAHWTDLVLQRVSEESQTSFTDAVKELNKAIISEQPHLAIAELKENGQLIKVIPEFEASWGPLGEQHKFFHPEGNVWIHTLMVLEKATIFHSPAVRYAALFHDIAKPLCFHLRPDGNISNQGHDTVGANLFEQILAPRLSLSDELTSAVGFLIRYHMKVKKIDSNEASHIADNKYMLSHPLLKELGDLSHADAYGTTVPTERKAEKCKKDFIDQYISARAG